MNDKQYKTSLRPHKDGGKMVCPSCGRKSFVPYIYNDTGDIVDSTCGRCDHVQSCGYHLAPAEFFKNNPDAKPIEKHEAYSKPQPSIINFCTLDEWKVRQTADEAIQCDFAVTIQRLSYSLNNVLSKTPCNCNSVYGYGNSIWIESYGIYFLNSLVIKYFYAK